MSRALQQVSKNTHLLYDIQNCPLFSLVPAEQLLAFSRFCYEEVFEEKYRECVDVGSSFVIVAEGIFEKVRFVDVNEKDDPNNHIFLEELLPGSFWGEHLLISDGEYADELGHIGLRAMGKGRLITIEIGKFDYFWSQFQQVRDTMLKHMLIRSIRNDGKISKYVQQVEKENNVLDRVENIANFMFEIMEGDVTRDNTFQVKYLLKNKPALPNEFSPPERIEQGYLSGDEKKEDRVRKTVIGGKVECIRTTVKRSKSNQKKTFERKITEKEFDALMMEIIGNPITKTRTSLQIGEATKITVDTFTGKHLKGLWVAEVDFTDVEAKNSFVLPEYLSGSAALIPEENDRFNNLNLAFAKTPPSL